MIGVEKELLKLKDKCLKIHAKIIDCTEKLNLIALNPGMLDNPADICK